MNQKEFSMRKIDRFSDWLKLFLLYYQSFPPAERKPISIIVSMWKKGKTDIWILVSNGKFAGFASTMNGEKAIMIDYLAVKKSVRGRGIGSKGLKALFNAYPDQGVLVEIESAFEEGRDREERLKRKQFYLNNGMKPLHVMMIVFGVKMELLSVRCHMNFQEYHDFYRINYSEYAAKHILPADYPEDIID